MNNQNDIEKMIFMEKVIGISTFLFIIIIVTYWLDDGAENIEEISSSIINVHASADKTTYIRILTRGGDTDLIGVAFTIKKIMLWNEKQPNTIVEKFNFTIKVPTIDKFGNKGSSVALHLNYDIKSFGKVQWENLGTWGILDLSQRTVDSKFGEKLIYQYCSDPVNKEYSRSFCNF